MKKYLASFATPKFYESQKKLNLSALKFGIDEVIPYNDRILKKTLFYRQNKAILNQERGAGYWLWKPYIILDTINKINDVDLLFYSDAGAEITRDISPLVDICIAQEGILLFKHIHRYLTNKEWTKRDCFVLMNCDSEAYWNAEQVRSNFQLYMKNEKNRKFLEEWMHYCKIPEIITDLPNTCGLNNFPEFKDHRHDQSVLSLLAVKYGIELFRDPSQRGDCMKMEKFREPTDFLPIPYKAPMLNSCYNTLLNHHHQSHKPKRWWEKYNFLKKRQ